MRYSNFKLSSSKRLLIGLVLISMMTMSILPLIGVQTNETRASAWGNNPLGVDFCDSLTSTHDKILQAAIDMLNTPKYYSLYIFYDWFRPDMCKAQAETDTEGDVHSTYDGWHLWSTSSVKNPLRAFNEELEIAKLLTSNSVLFLARALHFVQDMTQPYHAGGIGVNESNLSNDPHFRYELYATALSPSTSLSPLLYNSISNGHDCEERFFYEALNHGLQLFDSVDMDPSLTDTEKKTAQTGINIATQLTAGLLIYFYYHYYYLPDHGGGTGGANPM